MAPLTTKQQRFVDFYAGNGTEAARLAGYSGDDNTLGAIASENLRKPSIAEAISKRRAREDKPNILSRQQRQELWSRVAADENEEMQHRLRASELLGKSEADFVDRLDHSGEVHIAVVDPYAVKP